MDATMLSDAIHRGAGQILPTFRRACLGAVLLAQPALQEPVCSLVVTVPETRQAATLVSLVTSHIQSLT